MQTANEEMSGSLVLHGVLAILFGIAAVFWPGLTLVTLVYLFSTFILVTGLVDLIFSIRRVGDSKLSVWSRFGGLLLGILQLGVGVYLLRHPHVGFATFILLIGFTLIFRGLVEVVLGLFEKGNSALFKMVMILSGLISLVVGVVVLLQPVASGVAFVWILGLYALVTGPMFIALGSDARKLEESAAKRK
jgi:uncharacterized membrane protein HdeD (DUF308 family)